MTAAERYVAAAYLVVFVLVLAYVLIIATKLQRLERALEDVLSERDAEPDEPNLAQPTLPAASEHRGAVGAQTR